MFKAKRRQQYRRVYDAVSTKSRVFLSSEREMSSRKADALGPIVLRA